jgi:hypothetical protein
VDEPTSKLSPTRDLFLIGKGGVEQAKPAAGPIPKDAEPYLRVDARRPPLGRNAFWGIRMEWQSRIDGRQRDHWGVSKCASSTAKQTSRSASSM